MTPEQALAELKKGKAAPCYLLYGEQEYLIQETLNDLLDLIIPVADRAFGLFSLDGDAAEFDLLKDHLLSASLLGGKKVVVVKETTIFQPRETPGELIVKIRENLDEHPDKAAAFFLTFLKISGFTWEDMQGDGWRKITDEQWRKVVAGNDRDDRSKWLPRVVEICTARGRTAVGGRDQDEQYEKLLTEGIAPGNCLIMTATAVDKRKKLFKTIDKTGVVLYFGLAKKEAQTRQVLTEEAAKLFARNGKSLTAGAWAALGGKTGFELRSSLNELEKLILYSGHRQVIDEKDVEAVVSRTREDKVFDLTAALAEKNVKAALAALGALLEQGEHPLMILSMIGREVRHLLQASLLIGSGKLPKVTSHMQYAVFQKNVYPAVTALVTESDRGQDLLINKHPYVIFSALRACGRFTRGDLLSFLNELLAVDLAMKSSATEPRLLLERFLVKACSTVS